MILHGFQVKKYLVVITKLFNAKETNRFLKRLFGSAWSFGIVEMNALIFTSNASWSLVTYHPFDNEDCFTLTYKTIATFTPSNYTLLASIPFEKLYPGKLKNLRKCPLTVAVIPSAPYVIEVNEKNRRFDGIDVRIIETLANSINLTTTFIIPQEEYGSDFCLNITNSECLQKVVIFCNLDSNCRETLKMSRCNNLMELRFTPCRFLKEKQI